VEVPGSTVPSLPALVVVVSSAAGGVSPPPEPRTLRKRKPITNMATSAMRRTR